MLQDEEWGEWSNCEIARKCCVSEFFVRKLRRRLTSINRSERTYNTKHGTKAKMKVNGIGVAKPVEAPEGVTVEELCRKGHGDGQFFMIHEAEIVPAPRRFDWCGGLARVGAAENSARTLS